MQRMVQSKYAQDTARGVEYAQCKGQCRRMNMAASRRLLEARFSLAPSLLKGGTPCWGGGTVQPFGTLWTIPSSWDLHASVLACMLNLQSCDQQVRFSLAPCSGVRGPVGRAVFRVHSNPFQHFGQCSPHIGTGRLSDHAPDVATCILDVHKVRLACRILRQARSCDLHIGVKFRRDEGLQIILHK